MAACARVHTRRKRKLLELSEWSRHHLAQVASQRTIPAFFLRADRAKPDWGGLGHPTSPARPALPVLWTVGGGRGLWHRRSGACDDSSAIKDRLLRAAHACAGCTGCTPPCA